MILFVFLSEIHFRMRKDGALFARQADGIAVLYVVHTWPENENGSGRIISARRATHKERSRYEEG